MTTTLTRPTLARYSYILIQSDPNATSLPSVVHARPVSLTCLLVQIQQLSESMNERFSFPPICVIPDSSLVEIQHLLA